MRHKKDGGTYRQVVLKKYDLSPLVGFPAFAEEMPILRCSECGDEMLSGEILEPLLANVAARGPRRRHHRRW